MVINYEILYYFIFSSAFILPLRQNNSHALKHRCWRDIEGGGHAPDHVPLDGRAARRRRRRRRRIAAAVVRREGHYAVSGVIAER